MLGEGLMGADGDVVEQAETHGALPLGVVARRAHGAEGVLSLAGIDRIDGGGEGASGPERRGAAARREDRVRVQVQVARFGTLSSTRAMYAASWTRSIPLRSASGAWRRSRAANSSASRAFCTARSRSGHSG